MSSFLLLLLVALALLFATFAFLIHPGRYVLLYFAIAPLIHLFWWYQIGNFSIVDLFSGILPICFIFLFLYRLGQNNWRFGHFHLSFLIYLTPFLWHVIQGASTGDNLLPAMESFIKIFVGFASYSLFINVFPAHSQQQLVRSILIAMSIIAAMVAVQLVTGWGAFHVKGAYLMGWYHNPAEYSNLSLISLVILLPIVRYSLPGWQQFSRFLLAIICFWILLMGVSRSYLLALGGAVFVYCLLEKNYAIMISLVIASALLYLASPTLQDLYSHKLRKEVDYLQGGDSYAWQTMGSGRLGVWQRVLQEYEKASWQEKLFGRGEGIGPHGQFFGLLRRCGLVGLLISCVFYWQLLRFLWPRAKLAKGRPDAALYALLLWVTILLLAIGTAPLFNIYLQAIFFAFVALAEKRSLQTTAF